MISERQCINVLAFFILKKKIKKKYKKIYTLFKKCISLHHQINHTYNYHHMKAQINITPADQILSQLGGRKFIAMTGAVCYSSNDGKTLIVKFKGSKVANIMYVTLNEIDTYDVKICKFKGMDMKPVKEVKGAYADMLKNIFETTTFLRTSL